MDLHAAEQAAAGQKRSIDEAAGFQLSKAEKGKLKKKRKEEQRALVRSLRFDLLSFTGF